MKKIRTLPPIETSGKRDFVALTAQKIVDDVLDATKVVRSSIKRFRASGDPESMVAAMNHLMREFKRLHEEAVAVKRLVGLTESQDRSRIGKKTYTTTQTRQWNRWCTEIHEPSLFDPSRVFLEPVTGEDAVSVYWRGKHIGHVKTCEIIARENPLEPISTGYYVTNPFKIAYKKPHYKTFDDAIGRLVNELSRFVAGTTTNI